MPPVRDRIRGMTTREKAHKLLDELPESEIEPVVEFIVSRGDDPVTAAFRDAPEDDEPWTEEDEAAAAEGRADIAAGRTVSLEEIKREFDLL
jgi:predicted transcriptional regulator